MIAVFHGQTSELVEEIKMAWRASHPLDVKHPPFAVVTPATATARDLSNSFNGTASSRLSIGRTPYLIMTRFDVILDDSLWT